MSNFILELVLLIDLFILHTVCLLHFKLNLIIFFQALLNQDCSLTWHKKSTSEHRMEKLSQEQRNPRRISTNIVHRVGQYYHDEYMFISQIHHRILPLRSQYLRILLFYLCRVSSSYFFLFFPIF